MSFDVVAEVARDLLRRDGPVVRAGGNGTAVAQHGGLSNDVYQHRIAIIVMAALSIGGGLFMLGEILYTAFSDWNGSRRGRTNSDSTIQRSASRFISHADVFALLFSLTVLTQGGIVVVATISTLNINVIQSCRMTAELIWPAIWIVVLTTFAFGIETTLRSFRKLHFGARGAFETPACALLVIVMLAVLWVIAFLMPAQEQCLGPLVWWTSNYAKVAVVLAGCLILSQVICATVIIVQLLKFDKIDRDERVASSRMVYSLALSVIILALALPFYIEILFSTDATATESSRIADIALLLSGVVGAVLHMFLRWNPDRFVIRSRDAIWAEDASGSIFTPNNLHAIHTNMFISSPVLETHHKPMRKAWIDQSAETLVPLSPRTTKPPRTQYDSNQPTTQPFTLAHPPRTFSRQARHLMASPTPTELPGCTPPGPWPTVRSGSNESLLPPPPPLQLLLSPRSHRRNDSNQTSATVEFGLRMSSVMPEVTDQPSYHQHNHSNNSDASCATINVHLPHPPQEIYLSAEFTPQSSGTPQRLDTPTSMSSFSVECPSPLFSAKFVATPRHSRHSRSYTTANPHLPANPYSLPQSPISPFVPPPLRAPKSATDLRSEMRFPPSRNDSLVQKSFQNRKAAMMKDLPPVPPLDREVAEEQLRSVRAPGPRWNELPARPWV